MSNSNTNTNVRRRLEQFVANPDCLANVLSAIGNIPMDDVVAAEGGAAAGGQSSFAIARGAKFEQKLFDNNALELRQALAKQGVLPTVDVNVVDLRVHGRMSQKGLVAASIGFEQLLRGLVDSTPLPMLVIAPAMRLPGQWALTDSLFAIDVLTIHPTAHGSHILRVGEIKVYPDRGGHTDTTQLAGARSQMGLYVHILRCMLHDLSLESQIAVADDGFLILSSARSAQPSVRAGEDLRWQARRAGVALQKLASEIQSLAARSSASPLELTNDSIRSATTCYNEHCLGFCSRARLCRHNAARNGDPSVLGSEVAQSLGTIRLDRATALLQGTAAPQDDRERSWVEQMTTRRLQKVST